MQQRLPVSPRLGRPEEDCPQPTEVIANLPIPHRSWLVTGADPSGAPRVDEILPVAEIERGSWAIGAALPALFLSSLYYFDDWNMLGITPPPPGRRWVRYGPDLLLVNIRNGRVEDVIYGAFY